VAGYLPQPLRLRSGVSGWWFVASGLAAADAVTTYFGLHGRIGYEVNPVVAWLIGQLGLLPVMLARATLLGAGAMGVVALFASCDRRLLRNGSFAVLVAGVLFWSAVLANNLLVLTR
jgi:hypothetical protein